MKKKLLPRKKRVYTLPPFEVGLSPEAQEFAKKYSMKEIAEMEIAEMEKQKKADEENANKKKRK